MKATELRIGNYLNGKQGHVIITEIRTNNSVKILDNTSSFYVGTCLQPIPLTEEWLLKFGFKQISERVYIKNYHYGYEFGITNIFIIKNDNYFMRYKHIQHVHELQNLYFALTGEELILWHEQILP